MNNKDQKGFTVMEIIISMGIFMTAFVVMSDAFVTSNRSKAKTIVSQELQADARYTIESIAQLFRLGQVDYPYYEAQSINLANGPIGGTNLPWTTSQNQVVLLDSEGAQIRYRLGQHNSRGVTQISLDSGATWVNITPDGATIDNLLVYISPFSDPFNPDLGGLYASDLQPILTVYLETTDTTLPEDHRPTVELQSTISSSVYLR